MRPRFSIVIPCRERHHTLPHTLRTCLVQAFEDFEVVVADNCSSGPIHAIVEGFGDKRIRYVRSERLLAMSDSWDFAMSHAQGEYCTVVGNDDGLLLHALFEIDRLLRMLDTKVLRWESVCYNWPDLPIQEHALPNAMLIPLKQADDYYAIERRDSVAMIRAAGNSRLSYTELPMVQSSAIHHSIIERLRAQTGRVFHSQCPDIYSSFAIAKVAGFYHSVAAPMTINGLSGKSNGVACIYLKEKSPIAEEFRSLNTQARHVPHPQAPDVPVMPAYVADSFLHARDRFFADDAGITLDRKRLAVNCIEAARFADDDEWRHFRAKIRGSISDDANLLAWFDAEFGSRPLASLNMTHQPLKRYGGSHMNLDASEFGVTNIFEAAQLCEKLLGCKREGLNAQPAPASRSAANGNCSSGETSVASLQWIEIALYRLLSSLTPTRHMIDVGAHHGTSLEPFLHAGWSVHAFEPIETNRRQLAASFGTAPGLVIRPEAVSNKTGTAAFHLALNLDGSLHEYHHSLEQIHDDAWHKKGATVAVPIIRLDDLVARSEIPARIGFLKIDTEGHDLAVLQGAGQLTCDVISVEFWGDDHALGKSPSPAAEMVELLRSRGYDSYIVLCHDGDATTASYSTLERVRGDSWGNIFFFHHANPELFRAICEHPHWLLVLEMSGACDMLRCQLRDKEATIRDLDTAATDRLSLVQRLVQNLKLAGTEHLNEVAEHLKQVTEMAGECDRLRVQLDEKEAAIHGLDAVAIERLKLIEQFHQAFAQRRSPLQAIWNRIARSLPGFTGEQKKDAA